MLEDRKKLGAIFSIIVIIASIVIFSPEEDSGVSMSHNYPYSEIEIFSSGEVIDFNPNSVNFHQNWTVSPELPNGLRMFKDSYKISEKAIDSYENRTCTISPTGGIICWSGFSEFNGLSEVFFEELPDGENVATGISVGGKHSCALINNSVSTDIKCWGSDSKGQIGDGSIRQDRNYPTSVEPKEGSWGDISSGDSHSCGILSRSEIYCWGGGEFGQIGDGSRIDRFAPTRVIIEGDRQFVSIESGDFHNCALSSEGEVWCWGWNGYGQIGNGNFEDTGVASIVNLGPGVNAKSIVVGPVHSCAIIETNRAYCWGGNSERQISPLEIHSVEEPLEIFPDVSSKVGMILTGGEISCLADGSGDMICIGSMSSQWSGEIEEMGEARYFSPGRGGFCLLNYLGHVKCADGDGSRYLMTEEGGVIQMVVPTILDAGSISGVAMNNGSSRHNITSNYEGEEFTTSIMINIDFGRDVDSDGWLNYEESVCGSEPENKFSTPLDTDSDGECDIMDEDDDGDGVLDFKDKFPLDDSEWADDDGDGIGKNSDSIEISEPVYGIFVTMSILICLFILEIRNSSSRKGR